MERAQPVV